MEIFLIGYAILSLIYLIIGSKFTMETVIATIIALTGSIIGVVATSIKERKDIANLKEYVKDDIKEYLKNDIKEYLKNDIKEYLQNDIKKDLTSTNEITKYSIDPNVLKILENAEFIKEDIKNKNLLSEEYKGKINRNLMIANVESVYDKIVELEIEKSKIKEDFTKEKNNIEKEKNSIEKEKDQILQEKNNILYENKILEEKIYYLNKQIEEIKKEKEKLRQELEEKKPKRSDRGFSR